MNTKCTLLLLFSLFFYGYSNNVKAQTCDAATDPVTYTVVQAGGGVCLLQINWGAEVPEIGCGTPGTPVAGSTLSTRTLFDMQVTVNSTVYTLYDRGNGNSCNNAVTDLVYGPEVNTHITVISNADFCLADGEASIRIVANQSGGASINCDLANSNVAQPVELVSFQGYAMDKTNMLTWETESEENAMVFVLERSNTGKAPFEEIGAVQAAGFSTTLKSYEFEDRKPLPVSYYRLRNVDFDGATEYSDLIVVERSLENIFDVIAFPNPLRADQPVQIYFEAEREEKTRITLSDLLGRTLYTENRLTQQGVNRLEFMLNADVDAELYILSIDNGEEVIVKKLMGEIRK